MTWAKAVRAKRIALAAGATDAELVTAGTVHGIDAEWPDGVRRALVGPGTVRDLDRAAAGRRIRERLFGPGLLPQFRDPGRADGPAAGPVAAPRHNPLDPLF